MSAPELNETCTNCAGVKWVCENHKDRPWSAKGCECGAGMPCPICHWEYATAGSIGSAVWPDELIAEADGRQALNPADRITERGDKIELLEAENARLREALKASREVHCGIAEHILERRKYPADGPINTKGIFADSQRARLAVDAALYRG